MSGFILLASYPKSGNTWLRILLHSIWNDGQAVDLNALSIPNAADRSIFSTFLGLNSSDLTLTELINVRPRVFEFAARSDSWRQSYLKTHDAWLKPPAGDAFPFPDHVIDAVLYLVRDPRDVAVSFAHHIGLTIDETIKVMADPRYSLARQGRTVNTQVPQFLSSWSAHAMSWIDSSHFPVHLLRYEDMLADPENVFGDALEFVGLDVSRPVLRRAIDSTRFDVLRKQEEGGGFKERSAQNERFFRRGVARDWTAALTAEQARQVEADHDDAMRMLGYVAA